MSSGYELVGVSHIGGREQVKSGWKTIRAVFHNFAGMPQEPGRYAKSDAMDCHGFPWEVRLYPRGFGAKLAAANGVNSSAEHVSIFVMNRSGRDLKVEMVFRVPSANFTRIHKMNLLKKDGGTGWPKYVHRSTFLDQNKGFLIDGNLVVEVDIQAMIDKSPTWSPTNTLSLDMLKLLTKHSDDFDVTFQVGGDNAKEFHAHRTILKVRAPVLADIIADYPDSSTDIPIKDVVPDIFRMLLRFIYGGELPSDEVLSDQARPIIHAADKYGCTGLKLAAEAKMAAAGISTDDAAELILFADATNCAMLKEAAMEYFVANAEDVMASEGYKQVAESPAILGEMVGALAAGNKKRSAGSSEDDGRDFKRMRVATLRQKLDEKGLDVDGSKEMLVSRLEEAAMAEDNATFVMVSGAGLSNVNGKYRRTEEICDGVPVYRMEGSWQEIIGSFALYQCSLGGGLNEWFIAYVRNGTKPGTSKDVDFYSSTESADDSSPPTTGWHVLGNGEGPPPAVQMHGLVDHN